MMLDVGFRLKWYVVSTGVVNPYEDCHFRWFKTYLVGLLLRGVNGERFVRTPSDTARGPGTRGMTSVQVIHFISIFCYVYIYFVIY
jgi:hypothetical protein